jgi:hypothetical protein
MTCEQATELLPWHLNGSLDAEEARQVAEHLATCADCRKALAETRLAWQIFDQHLPAETLVALAWGEMSAGLAGIDPELAEEHLRVCPQCAADLELARTSRALEQEDGVALLTPRRQQQEAPVSRRVRSGWRSAALAAGLAGVVAAGGWFQSADHAHDLEARLARPATSATVPSSTGTDRERLAALAAQLKQQNETEAELRGRLETMEKQLGGQQVAQAAPSPLTNTWPLMMEPTDVVRSSEAAEIKEVKPGFGVNLLLTTHQSDLRKARHVEIADASGHKVLSLDGLVPDPEYSSVSISLTKGFLKPGSYTARVSIPGGPVESYSFKVR